MQPIINLEEQPGKVVGRRVAAKPLASGGAAGAADARAWQRAVGGIRVQRGVYRFRTHEEADVWLWEKLTQPRR